MSRTFARILLTLLTLIWSGWSLLLYVGLTLGDCRDDACHALRDQETQVVLWRWLAVLLAMVVVYLLNSRALNADARLNNEGG